MTKKKESTIHIPHQLIDNTVTDSKVPVMATYLYTILKLNCKNNISEIYVSTLKDKLQWNSTKTLKKYLIYLKQNNYINYDGEDLPRHNKMIIKITNMSELSKLQGIIFKKKDGTHINGNLFEQIPRELIGNVITHTSEIQYKDKSLNLQEYAIRLIAYYTKQTNVFYGYSFPSFREAQKATGMSTEYISLINKTLEDNEIFEIVHGKYYEEEYESEDKLFNRRIKERNKYSPKA